MSKNDWNYDLNEHTTKEKPSMADVLNEKLHRSHEIYSEAHPRPVINRPDVGLLGKIINQKLHNAHNRLKRNGLNVIQK